MSPHLRGEDIAVLLLVNKILQTYYPFVTPPSPLLCWSLCFLLTSILSPRLDTRLSHIQSAIKLCFLYWWNIFFFLISLLLPLFWTWPPHLVAYPSCPPTLGCCDSFRSHQGCKLIVSPGITYIHCQLDLPKARLWLHHFCVKNCPWILSALGAKTRIPSLSIKVLCGWLPTTCLGLFFINSR